MNDLEKKNNVTMSDAKEEKEMIRENQLMEDNGEKGSKFIDEFSDKLESENDNESISRINEHRRSMSSESKEESTAKYRDVLSGTSVNPTRRSSIASAAICSSLVPSLAGAFPGVPSNFLPRARETSPFGLRRSVTLSNLSFVNDTTLEVIDTKKEEGKDDRINKERDRNDDGNDGKRKSKLSFLHLHIPESAATTAAVAAAAGARWDLELGYHHHHHYHHHHVFPHIHVPVITFTAPATDGTGRKFNFGIRKHSQTVPISLRLSF